MKTVLDKHKSVTRGPMLNTKNSMLALTLMSLITAAGCSTPNTGIVPIGSGLYMASKFGSMVTFSGGEVKAELYRDASAFCAKSGKEVAPASSTSQDSAMATYASAEIQFRCQ